MPCDYHECFVCRRPCFYFPPELNEWMEGNTDAIRLSRRFRVYAHKECAKRGPVRILGPVTQKISRRWDTHPMPVTAKANAV